MEPQGQATVALESKCDVCDGRGWSWEKGDKCRCGVCDGAGYVPTDLGEQILSLVRHNLRPMYDELAAR
jgi:DnaJ-class molecular chaperone